MQTDSQSFRAGFLKTATAAGLTPQQAEAFYKRANQDQGGAMLPPPPEPGTEAPGGGEMAQLEQLLQSLPPEQQEQVIQQLIAELTGQGGPGGAEGGAPGGPGAGGPPPGAGGPPPQGAGGPPPQHGGHPGGHGGMPPQGGMDPKMGSELVIKQAEYVDSFFRRGLEYGFDVATIKHIYKTAAAFVEQSQGLEDKQAQEKIALHFNSFAGRAAELGFSRDQAVELYQRLS